MIGLIGAGLALGSVGLAVAVGRHEATGGKRESASTGPVNALAQMSEEQRKQLLTSQFLIIAKLEDARTGEAKKKLIAAATAAQPVAESLGLPKTAAGLAVFAEGVKRGTEALEAKVLFEAEKFPGTDMNIVQYIEHLMKQQAQAQTQQHQQSAVNGYW